MSIVMHQTLILVVIGVVEVDGNLQERKIKVY